MWVVWSSPDCLRDVPIPWETMPGREGPAGRAYGGAYIRAIRGNAYGEPGIPPREVKYLPGGLMNRERELGLDRRETG